MWVSLRRSTAIEALEAQDACTVERYKQYVLWELVVLQQHLLVPPSSRHSSQFAQVKMRFSSPLAFSLLAGTLSNALPAPQDKSSSTVSAPPSSITFTAASTDAAVAADQLDRLSDFAQQQVNASLAENNSKRGGCNLSNVAVRREWNSLSKKERKSYTDAVLCLQKKKTKTPASLIPGARSRFDDWVGVHINQTMTIHYTGTFLACE